MSVKILTPGNGTKLNLNDLVKFEGTADDNVTTIAVLSPFGNQKFLLGKASANNGRWSLSYKFNTGGEREIVVSGFDAANNMISSDQIKIQLQANEDGFDFPEPSDSQRQKSLMLWATFYNVHRARSIVGGNALLDKSGNSLGPTLSDQDWCVAALEGTVQVTDDSDKRVTYNFASRGTNLQVDCSRFFPGLSSSIIQAMNRSRFAVAKGPFGDGTGGFILVPFRTIAVDKDFIPLGSVVFIPAARGKKFTLPSGKTAIHDGYFFAADVGGAINDNHIDVFLGIATSIGEFSFIKSNPSSTFSAFLISNPQISNALKIAHQANS